jgi:hypothetical protein
MAGYAPPYFLLFLAPISADYAVMATHPTGRKRILSRAALNFPDAPLSRMRIKLQTVVNCKFSSASISRSLCDNYKIRNEILEKKICSFTVLLS